MRTLGLSLVLFVLSFGATSLIAQQKIAFVNTQIIIEAMPEYRSAQAELEAFGKQIQKNLEKQEQQLMAEYQKLTQAAQQGTLSPVQQKQAEEKLQKMGEDFQLAQQKASQDAAAKEGELTQPMYEKFKVALEKVAQQNGFSYIIDEKLLLYSAGGIDASDMIKKELGIQ